MSKSTWVGATWLPSSIPFFMFGFLYYFVSPYFVMLFSTEGKAVEIAEKYIDLSFFDARYWLDIFVVFVSWLFGYLYFSRKKYSGAELVLDKVSNYKIAPGVVFLFLIIVYSYAVYFSLSRGAVFFSGYAGEYDPLVLGQFSTLVFVAAWFFNFFHGWRKVLFLGVFLLSSLILLGLGARMYFLMGLISIFLGFVHTRKRLMFNPVFMTLIGFAGFFVVFVGFWRLGLDISLDNFLYIFFAEPLFTLTSASQFVENVGRPMYGLPIDIFVGFLNFVPTAIWPSKLDFISSFSASDDKLSPFGASSLYVNMYFNFGCFFWIYSLVTGCVFGFLKRRASISSFYRAIYFSVLPLLLFLYYRDGFMSMIKISVFNSYIFPMTILLFLMVLLERKPGVSAN